MNTHKPVVTGVVANDANPTPRRRFIIEEYDKDFLTYHSIFLEMYRIFQLPRTQYRFGGFGSVLVSVESDDSGCIYSGIWYQVFEDSIRDTPSYQKICNPS